MNNRHLKTKKGILTMEIMAIAAIISIALVSFLGVFSLSLKIGRSTQEIVQANTLAEETMEAVRSFRNRTEWDTDGLGTVSVGSDYYPEKSGSPLEWGLAVGEETINAFSRKVIFEQVMRDADDNIVEAGGVNDPETRKATVLVSWNGEVIEISTYFTNWR